ncbi:hypothetical protein L3X38_009646 [Prunus dulcis]|uniref:Retrovirus-related Pol polyprotein from transposon TNT 1-94-like beta-barrel domain-containing protein n=1 Tax=Prunus dulcis TaxID=3755 RepID=A0AAD4WES0_PRUDU|nr:hypothetical protein L3X38_009646 [Prunus dulcis]
MDARCAIYSTSPPLRLVDVGSHTRALGLVQSAVSDQIFHRIVNEETSKGAWDILKQEFRGDKQKVNYANQIEETGTLFYACYVVTDVKLNNSWYFDSGCSNHMTGDERLLVDIRRDVNSKVKMGTVETVQVAGKGTLVIDTKAGRKHIQEVMLLPGLEE